MRHVNEEFVVVLPPVRCRYNLAKALWDRRRLFVALLECVDPPGSIARAEAEALADSIIAGTGQSIVVEASQNDDWPAGFEHTIRPAGDEDPRFAM